MKNVFYFLICVFIWIMYKSKQFNNPYKLTMVFGKKGAGKTTYLTKLSIKYNKLGYKVFSNVEIFGTYKLNVDDLGVKDFPPNSVILIDEVSLIWSNRDFVQKEFREKFKKVERYFRLQRHYKNVVFLFSQSFDIDKKIRDLCDEMYLLTNLFGFISVARKINKVPTLHQPDQDSSGKTVGEGFITENYSFSFISDWKFIYIPRYIKFFNSYEIEYKDPISRNKYNFIDEPYLYKLTHYKFYIKDVFNGKIQSIKKAYMENKMAIKINENDFLSLMESNYSDTPIIKFKSFCYNFKIFNKVINIAIPES